jgi:hypothetical protein
MAIVIVLIQAALEPKDHLAVNASAKIFSSLPQSLVRFVRQIFYS